MSKVQIKGNASGTGIFTIAAPNTNTDYSITLPTSSATLATTSSPTFTGDVTFDTDTLVVDSTNNKVGIGKSSPSYKLDVNGNMRVADDIVLDNGAADGAQLRLESSGYDAWYWDNYSGNLRAINGTTERMRIDSSGNVGIGTNSPLEKVHVYTGSSGVSTALGGVDGVIIESGASRTGGLLFFTPNDRPGKIIWSDPDAHDRGEISYAHSSDSMSFATAGSTAVTIDSSGNVGIGNSSPSSFNSLSNSNQLVLGDGTATTGLTCYSSSSTGFGHIAFADSNTSGSTAQYAGLIQYYHGDNTMRFYSDATERLRLSNAEAKWTNTTSGFYNKIYGPSSGDISSGYLTYNGSTLRGGFYTNPTHGLTIISDVDLSIRANNANRMHIDTSGRVTMPYQPAFIVSKDTDSYTTAGTKTAEFNDKTTNNLFDRGNNFDTSNHRFTAPVAGVYWFSANIRLDGASTGYFRLLILKNGTGSVHTDIHTIMGNGISTNYDSMTASGAIELAANDYVIVEIESNSDTSFQIHSESTFSGFLIG